MSEVHSGEWYVNAKCPNGCTVGRAEVTASGSHALYHCATCGADEVIELAVPGAPLPRRVKPRSPYTPITEERGLALSQRSLGEAREDEAEPQL